MTTPEDLKRNAHTLKALAHPTRLLIVESLLEGEKCVLAIQDLLHASQPNVSQHLNILKFANIVDFAQKGNLRCYYLKDPQKIAKLLQVIS